jgi:hypothetical protein
MSSAFIVSGDARSRGDRRGSRSRPHAGGHGGIESFAQRDHAIQGGFLDRVAPEGFAHHALHAIAVGGARDEPLA